MSALYRLMASSTPASIDKWDSADVQYAVPADEASLYRMVDDPDSYTASKGGISDSTGDPSINFEILKDPKPNAQKSLNGTLRMLSALINADSAEDDPLTHDQEDYGSGGTFVDADSVTLLDPSTSSSYARENNVNRNTTDRRKDPPSYLKSKSTVDQPEPATGYDPKGQEGLTVSKSTNDGDFDPAGRQTGDRLITQDPKTSTYYGIIAGPESEPDMEDAMLYALADGEEVDADADTRIYNLATQPMGMSG